MDNLKINKILWLLIAIISLFVSIIGVLKSSIYEKVISPDILPGIVSQDITTIIVATVLIICVIKVGRDNFKIQIIILGIISYLFYAYGIYVIERVYNIFYLFYMSIFGLSFYSIIYGLVSIHKDIFQKIHLAKYVKILSIVFLFFIPIMFYIIWTSQLLPLIEVGEKIEYYYSIYIIDLCIIMPAFIIAAVKTIKNKGLGLFISPALFILGFSILFPVGLGELIKPHYNQVTDTGGMLLYLSLSVIFLILSIINLVNLKITEGKND